MKKAGWIVLTLFLVGGMTALVMAYGTVGWLPAILIVIMIFFGLDRYYRWRSSRLARSMNPSETLVASGLVSQDFYDETPAVLVKDAAHHYRLLVADSRGAVDVQTITPDLKQYASGHDPKHYLELNTANGQVYFAPRKSFLAARQEEHAREILHAILAGSSPPAGQSNSSSHTP